MHVKSWNGNSLELVHLKTGIYYIEIKDKNGNKTIKKCIKL